jgi:hypothetical protein
LREEDAVPMPDIDLLAAELSRFEDMKEHRGN